MVLVLAKTARRSWLDSKLRAPKLGRGVVSSRLNLSHMTQPAFLSARARPTSNVHRSLSPVRPAGLRRNGSLPLLQERTVPHLSH